MYNKGGKIKCVEKNAKIRGEDKPALKRPRGEIDWNEAVRIAAQALSRDAYFLVMHAFTDPGRSLLNANTGESIAIKLRGIHPLGLIAYEILSPL